MTINYLMEAGVSEAQRVEDKTDRAWTKGVFQRIGIPTRGALRALEVGCGPGTTSDCLYEALGDGARVIGVDMSAERIAYARSHYSKVTFQCAAAECLPFPDHTFDFVFSRFLFEYLKQPEIALKEMIRVVKPGGIVAVGDLDLNCTRHFGISSVLAQQVRAIEQLAARMGVFNSTVGGELFPMFHKQSKLVENIRHHCEIYHRFAGAIPAGVHRQNWQAKLQTLAPVGAQALGSKQEYAKFAKNMMDFLLNEHTLTYSVFHLVWAQRIL